MGEMSFSPEIQQWIAARLADGGYTDAGDYLLDLIRRDMEQFEDDIDWVRERIAEGEASGIADVDPFVFLDELRAGRHDGAS